MNKLNNIFESDIWQGLISLSPLALAFFLISFREPLFTTIPGKNELGAVEGSAIYIGKNSGRLNTPNGTVEINYKCLGNYGWGEKSFKKGASIHGFGEKHDNAYELWELSIGDTVIFSYEDIASEKLEAKESALYIAGPGIIISSLFLLQFGFRQVKGTKKQNKRKVLFTLLDNLADQSKPDDERLGYLSEILTYDSWEIIEPLELIAMTNTNSDRFLSKIGETLGALWSTMEIDDIEAILYIQAPAKVSAVNVMKKKNKDLITALEDRRAVIV